MKKIKYFLDYYSLLIVSFISVISTVFAIYCLDKSVLTLSLILKIAAGSFAFAVLMEILFSEI